MDKIEIGKGPHVPSGEKRKYLVAENWGHCFVGSKESTVRWVLEIGVGVIAGQVLNGGRWHDMHRSEIADMQEEIDDNNIVEMYATEHSGEIVLTEELPDWARPAKDHFVSVTGALLLMADGERVHTFTIMGGFHGCDIDRADLEARIVKAGGACISDRCGMKHELMILDQGRELFIECDRGRLQECRDGLRAGLNWPETQESRTVSTEQAALATKTLRQFWAQQRSRKELGTVLTLRLSNSGNTLVGWMVARTSTALRASHPFTRETMGWTIERERAFDDTSRHRRHLKVSPESQLAQEVTA